MQIERVKNASRNMVYAAILQVFKLVMPFAMRTAMLYLLGVEYLGLNSLFTSVLSVLNLVELGVGSAMVYSMYKPIVDDDAARICALMRLYKIYYRVIGGVVCVLGLLLLPFIPQLINGGVPADIDVYVLYLLNLSATVLSYWLFAYKNSILQAHQRNDMISKATLATESVKYVLQFLVLIMFGNYYLYVMVVLVTQVINNVLTATLAQRMYPQYKAGGHLPKTERVALNKRIRDLFTARIGTVAVYSSDNIVISAFLGLTALAVYQNYYYLFLAAASLITVVFSSVQAGLGNSIIVDTKEKVFADFKDFFLIIAWLAGFCGTCLLCLYQPFMELWVGKDLLLDFGMVVCLAAYFLVYCFNLFLNSYKDASGMWHADRFRPLVEAIVNVVLSVVLVQHMGLYGIVLGTIMSMLLVAPWLVHNLFRLVLAPAYLKPFLKRVGYCAVASVVVMAASYLVCSLVDLSLVLTFLVRLAICAILPNVLFFAFYVRLPEFTRCMVLVNRVTRGKVGLIRKLASRGLDA